MVDNVANGADGIVADAEEQRDYQRQRVVVADHRYRDIERRFGHPGQRQQFQDDWGQGFGGTAYGRCRYRGPVQRGSRPTQRRGHLGRRAENLRQQCDN